MSDEKKKSKDEKKKSSKAATRTRTEDSDIPAPSEAPPPRLRERYVKEIAPLLMKDLNLKNVMEVPRLEKIVLNAGLGKATQNIKIIDVAVKDMTSLAGQKPVTTKSKLAISNFKLRKGLPIGVMVTLRGGRMWEFLDRLISLTLPRIRDFRGVSDRGFDGRGNFTMGLKDHLVFPEVSYDSVDSTFGMNLTMVTTARTDAEGRALLGALGIPFRKRGTGQKAA